MTDLLTPGASLGAPAVARPSRVVSMPVGVQRQLAWPAQDPDAIHVCVLDCRLFLLDAGTVLASALVLCDPSLVAGGVSHDAGTVSLTLTGGAPGTEPTLGFALFLANGERANATVRLPIVALSPAVPDGAIAVGAQPITLAHVPIDVSQMDPPPGGLLPGDKVLVYRPGAIAEVYLLPAESLGGAAPGGVTPASLATLLALLPTSQPAVAGQAWLNGGVLALS